MENHVRFLVEDEFNPGYLCTHTSPLHNRVGTLLPIYWKISRIFAAESSPDCRTSQAPTIYNELLQYFCSKNCQDKAVLRVTGGVRATVAACWDHLEFCPCSNLSSNILSELSLEVCSPSYSALPIWLICPLLSVIIFLTDYKHIPQCIYLAVRCSFLYWAVNLNTYKLSSKIKVWKVVWWREERLDSMKLFQSSSLTNPLTVEPGPAHP